MDVSKDQVKAALGVVMALSETIRTLGEVPNGILYANLMGHLPYDSYTKALDMLKRTGLVTETGNVLRWTGPKIPA